MSVSRSKAEKSRYGKRYYLANREKVLARTRQWKLDNPERYTAKMQRIHNSINGRARAIFNSAKRRSVQYEEPFDLDLDWVVEQLNFGKCALTGIPFVLETLGNGRRSPHAPSLDRKDATKGYTKQNCRMILWALNMGFSDWGRDVYLEIAHRLVEFDL